MSTPAEQLRYGQVDAAYVAQLEAVDPVDDGPFLMLNLMRYRDLADYPAGHPDAGSGLTGRDADDRYAPLEILQEIGARIVLFGEVAGHVSGDDRWDRVAIVRYPSIRSFVDMQERPDFVERHVHKDAGMLRTIIAVCHPAAGTVGPGHRLQVELVGGGPPPTAYDGRLVLDVAGTPVRDGRRWTHAVVTDVTGGETPPVEGSPATGVVVDALLQDLP